MKKDISIYHATSAPGIMEFILGVKGVGETENPINAIWFGTKFEGALHHAVYSAGQMSGAKDVFVYECTLSADSVIADAKRTRMPPRNFKLLVEKHMPLLNRIAYRCGGWLRRKYARNYKNWFNVIYAVSIRFRKSSSQEDCYNAVIEVCESIGLDVLANPITQPGKRGLEHRGESHYGKIIWLINCKKAMPIIQYKFKYIYA